MKKKIIISLVSLFACSTINAASNNEMSYTKNLINAIGHWYGRLAVASANQDAYFIDENNQKVGQIYDFEVDYNNQLHYQFAFNPITTHSDILYILSLYEKNDIIPQSPARSCVFLINVSKETNVPAIHLEGVGGECGYKFLKGVGEVFTVG